MTGQLPAGQSCAARCKARSLFSDFLSVVSNLQFPAACSSLWFIADKYVEDEGGCGRLEYFQLNLGGWGEAVEWDGVVSERG